MENRAQVMCVGESKVCVTRDAISGGRTYVRIKTWLVRSRVREQAGALFGKSDRHRLRMEQTDPRATIALWQRQHIVYICIYAHAERGLLRRTRGRTEEKRKQTRYAPHMWYIRGTEYALAHL